MANDDDINYWIYAGGLPYELTEGDIICVFSQYGEIAEITLSRDRDTGKSRGFCFIKYEDSRSCELAIDNLNGVTVLGRRIKVSASSKRLKDTPSTSRTQLSPRDRQVPPLSNRLPEGDNLEVNRHDRTTDHREHPSHHPDRDRSNHRRTHHTSARHQSRSRSNSRTRYRRNESPVRHTNGHRSSPSRRKHSPSPRSASPNDDRRRDRSSHHRKHSSHRHHHKHSSSHSHHRHGHRHESRETRSRHN